ncbi:hypothetical protein RFM98_18080 [Mesorhizobium sp. VK9D]|uniref:hypothetical protein n=1 Tax=Mesorhizobium australafricanum TaxID=3072311 RepID=UPI002A23CA0A|nr:hypothetical protein [Mesorhizobium sp. VK9D]MDX8454674.1 hypothetical protein [Mesorhizobium sp. VK9D]
MRVAVDHRGEIVDAVVIDIAVDIPAPLAARGVGNGSTKTVVRVLPPGITFLARSNRVFDPGIASG